MGWEYSAKTKQRRREPAGAESCPECEPAPLDGTEEAAGLTSGGQFLGGLKVTRSLHEIQMILARERNAFLGTLAAITLILIILISVLIHRTVSQPLGQLTERISALAIVVLLALHVTLTYKPAIQLLLLLAVTFHAALGLRVILLDFNLVGVRYQRALIWGLLALGLAVALIIWFSIY